ncbi:alpha/beta-hydrolase [Guyanagaster necrorhizus]|uniref:Alpha/beta-hydrolase n=1 Tax=Guyanagaster necrorhizus TaxID=856835 RepID=A0A9P7VJ12_9AGAR|nr:alpha/beta-hydrolase [Guyanagaster necrorhizus MCA 3950]KAG7442006.1 alpha/beta-hydrolase [Guyanagaster necrorhizus MCA 3950]
MAPGSVTEKMYSKSVMLLLRERIKFLACLAHRTVALYVLKRLVCSFFTRERSNSWRTICMAAAFRFAIDHSDLRSNMSSSLKNYLKWTESSNLPAAVDELPDGAHLLWIGPKQLDQVILYFHGGAYMMSCSGNVMTYCQYLHEELRQRNIHVGIAILAYSASPYSPPHVVDSFMIQAELVPDNPFPTQLRETKAALDMLLNGGAKPENITLAGASAGGNLVLQMLAHILHRLPSVEPIPETRFRGVFLMSPWVSMKADNGLAQHLLDAKHKYDNISSLYGRHVCRTLLKDISDTDIPFVDPLEAPEDWFNGIDRLADSVFVMWGEVECLMEGQKRLCNKYLEPYHPQVEMYEQVSGVHCQPIWDSAWMSNVGEPRIVEWFSHVHTTGKAKEEAI